MAADPQQQQQQFELTCAEKQEILRNFQGNRSTDGQIRSSAITRFTKEKSGFLGDHYLLTMVVVVEGTDEQVERKYSFFVKALPVGYPQLERYLVETKVFTKEAQLFDQLLPQLAEFGRFAPKCLFHKDGSLLVFENVKLEGFRTLEHNDGLLDLAHLEQALRVLAKLHAASLILESKLGKSVVEVFPGVLNENARLLEEGYPRVEEMEETINLLCAFVRHYEQNAGRKENSIEKLPEYVREIYALVKPSTVYRNVVSHGDLWNNNVMFRYSESGTPVDCLLVDFQLARYSPPAYDFNMLLTLTTTSGFRRKHINFLQGYYYQSLRMELSQHKLRIESIISQNEFQESCKLYRKAGAIDNFLIGHFVRMPKTLIDDIYSSPERHEQFVGDKKIKSCLQAFDEDPNYRARIVDIIENLLEVFNL